MRKIIVTDNVTLDGVMQAPGRRDEDARGGFTHGGWAVPYGDEVMRKEMGEGMGRGGDMLLGRWTYELLFESWHGRTDNPFSAVLDNARKYVVSNTLKEPLPWQNSTLLAGDAADSVAALKREPGKDLGVIGSGELVRALLRRDLVDQLVLLVYPLVLGSGRRLFADDGAFAKFSLVKSVPTAKGVIIATYEREETTER